MKLRQILSIILMVSTMSACASMNKHNAILLNHNDDYLRSESLAKMNIPPGVSFYPPDAYYTIPHDAAKSQVQISLLPPGSHAAQQSIAKSTGGKHAKG